MTEQAELGMKCSGTVDTTQARRVIKRELGRTISRKTVVRLIESGDRVAFRLHRTGQWAINSASLDKYIQRLRETPPN